MSVGVFVLLLTNFLMIGALPFLFFRRDGRFNARWLLTAAPFFVCPLVLSAPLFGVVLPGLAVGPAARTALDALAVPLSVASISVISLTIGSHRIPIALWHQDDDAPREIVTWGPYRRVRHPFYASFLLAFLAALVASPNAGTLVTLVYGAAALTVTAAREERRLQASAFGRLYEDYMRQTGRFWPAWGGSAR